MTTLAELQAERETLRAIKIKDEYEAALAETVSADLLEEAGRVLMKLLARETTRLANRLIEAVGNENDETRAHYLMSDTAHEVLTEIGSKAETACSALPVLGTAFRRGVKPRDLLTVSQWSDRHRWIKSGTNAPGKWQTKLTPYLAEIMDSLSEHSPVRVVTFIKSSGVGGTEAMYNWIGYIMHHLQNKDLLVVVPTLELRDRSFNPRLNKMLSETEVLSELASQASRSKVNRGDLLEYGAQARLIKAGANSPDSLRSDHLPYVICDEVDAFPWDVGGEGDPMTLIENRQRTYSRAKTYLVSTPTKANASRIDLQYRRSDMRQYQVPCPHCGELQVLEFGSRDTPYGLKWRTALPRADQPEGEQIAQVERAWYVCRHHGCLIEEAHKPDMLAKGRWIAQRPHIKLHRGYHINALYAPIGLGLTWHKVAQKWLDSQTDTAELKGFVNTYLGEVWEEKGDGIEGISLISRLEPYTPDTLPTRHVTAGVDVQKDRLEATFVAWGEGEEAWVLEHLIIPGDTTKPEVWAALHEDLVEREIKLAAIDSGYNAGMVYDFVKTRPWCVAIKGVTGTHRPLVEDEPKRLQRLRKQRKRGVPVEPIGVDQAKALIYARLKLDKVGPGYIHFPNDAAFDDEYFAQLAAEKLVTKIKGTRPFQEWIQTRPRNEALDCLVYSMSAFRLGPKPCHDRPKEAAPTQNSAPIDRRREVVTEAPTRPVNKPSRLNTFSRDW